MEHEFHKPSYDFYMWESRYRGYHQYPYRVDLEIPFERFERRDYDVTDDGLVPSFFERLMGKKTSSSVLEEIEYKVPSKREKAFPRQVLVLSFKGSYQSERSVWAELLSVFSVLKHSLSFEIMGTHDEITIQITCHGKDYVRVSSHLSAYFPSIIINEGEHYPLFFNGKAGDIAIADFGLEYEYMVPINSYDDVFDDSLRSIIATMDGLEQGAVAIFQILFQGIKSPLSRDTLDSVSDGQGGSFFYESEEVLEGAKSKVSSPLFACVVRIASQGRNKSQSKFLAQQLINSVQHGTDSDANRLIALSNVGYPFKEHIMNVFRRQSHRPGMILNAHELANLFHYPDASIVSSKLGIQARASKQAPAHALNEKYVLGENVHHKQKVEVSVSNEQRLSHMHIMGVTGVGKSTLMARLFLQDVKAGNGCVILDPHGDIIDDILVRIPKKRQKDVILLDPSDTDFPVGFNLLHAETEAEKIVLSSDLVATFRKYATSWGDRMTSVLANAIDTFLDSKRGGTLIELKRFLLEKKFRDSFLESVSDPQLLYYWEVDYALVSRSSITPLLIRLDTFLRPKIVRMMMAQKSGLDISSLVRDGKILLVKLAQGLIGEENAHLLGTLIVSKLGQVALGRQSIPKHERKPFYIHMDEFHHLITPSIADMVSGVRKFGVGLTLVHQDLTQLGDDRKLLRSVVSNPHIRMCFRLSIEEAKIMEQGFSGFGKEDLVSLERGEVIMRVGGSNSDFNVNTQALGDVPEHGLEIAEFIKERSRKKYAKPRAEVEELLVSLLPHSGKKDVEVEPKPKREEVVAPPEPPKPEVHRDFEKEVERLKENSKQEHVEREHEYLKTTLSKLAQDHGFRVVLEEATKSGGRVDIGIHNEAFKIACEISVTNTATYEVQNIQKCLDSGFNAVFVVSKYQKHLLDIEALAVPTLSKEQQSMVVFLHPDQFVHYLEAYIPKQKPTEKIIRGYRVKVNLTETSKDEQIDAQKSIAKTILESLKKKK